jgi:hypothetical protein
MTESTKNSTIPKEIKTPGKIFNFEKNGQQPIDIRNKKEDGYSTLLKNGSN